MRRPPWATGLPDGAVPLPQDVPRLGCAGRMTFEARWRAVTMLRLKDHFGWTLAGIGQHFGIGFERARQLINRARYPR